jgi:hypothetical protein
MASEKASEKGAKAWVDGLAARSTGRLRVEPFDRKVATDPCNISPGSPYRGAENQLYRVEIHTSGLFGKAQFKWSRENASVVLPVSSVARSNGKTVVTVDQLGNDERLSLYENGWAQLTDDYSALREPTVLDEEPAISHDVLKVLMIDRDARTVTLDGEDPGIDLARHPLLRRWDGPVRNLTEDTLVPLENGLQIRFVKAGKGKSFYRAGDYWLIPARTVTGDVEWPRTTKSDGSFEMEAVEAHGVEHAYALLAYVDTKVNEERHFYDTLAEPL